MNIIRSFRTIINKLDVFSPALMKKPKDLENHRRTMISLGRNLHTTQPEYGDPDYYHYVDKNVESKIKDDKYYKVWYSRRDAADPCDSTSYYTIYYIEEVSETRRALVKALKELLAELE